MIVTMFWYHWISTSYISFSYNNNQSFCFNCIDQICFCWSISSHFSFRFVATAIFVILSKSSSNQLLLCIIHVFRQKTIVLYQSIRFVSICLLNHNIRNRFTSFDLNKKNILFLFHFHFRWKNFIVQFIFFIRKSFSLFIVRRNRF